MITIIKKDNRWPAKKRTFTLKHIDSLIEELSSMHQCAKESNSPELVHLKRALVRAQHLRVLLNGKRTTSRHWNNMFDAVVFVLEVSKKIYSLFINYIKKQVAEYEFWNNNKIITHC